MIKLVLTDLDDTLIPAGQDGISDRAAAAIKAALDAGIAFGPNTGRPHAAMSWMFKNQSELYATGLYSNGMQGWLNGEVVFTKTVRGSDLYDLACYLEQSGIGVLAIYDDQTDQSTLVTHAPEVNHELLPPRRFIRSLMVPEKLPDEVLKCNVWISRPGDEINQIINLLNQKFPTMGFVSPAKGLAVADIVPAGWGKGAGALELARLMGITPDQVLVLGDSENDLDSIKTFTNSVAVANACDEVLEAARFVIDDTKNEAVAAVLERLAVAKPEDSMEHVVLGW